MTARTSPSRPVQGNLAVQGILQSSRFPILVTVFILGLIIPLIVNAGGVRLSVYRIVLLVLFFPALFKLLSGAAGRIKTSDIAIIVICLWSTLAILVVQGPLIETIGILIVETLGSYLIGRCYIRTPTQFLQMSRLFFFIILVIFPLAVFESLTGRELILQVFDMVGTAYPAANMDKRMGLYRAQGPFAHPIHFGLFFGAFIGLVYYVVGYGRQIFSRFWRTAVVAVTGALALSSGPLTALVAQVYMIIWDRVLIQVKSRWYILGFLAILAYIVIDVLSNRNPFQIFISYLAFNTDTAYNRIYIWIYGTGSIWANPLWGVGIDGYWSRPYWMSPSADMFWIVPAMRHGIVVWIGYFTLFFSITGPLIFRKFGPRLHAYRLGFLTTIFGLFMAGWTVHYWDATFAFFMFLLGSGVWMIDYKEIEAGETPLPDSPPEGTRIYSRFPIRPSPSRLETPQKRGTSK